MRALVLCLALLVVVGGCSDTRPPRLGPDARGISVLVDTDPDAELPATAPALENVPFLATRMHGNHYLLRVDPSDLPAAAFDDNGRVNIFVQRVRADGRQAGARLSLFRDGSADRWKDPEKPSDTTKWVEVDLPWVAPSSRPSYNTETWSR